MMRHCAVALAVLASTPLTSPADPGQPVTLAVDGVTVVTLQVRNAGEGEDSGPANQGFFFTVSAAYTYNCPNTNVTLNDTLLFVPKGDPTSTQVPPPDNPAYRDYVNTVMLAYLNARPITAYVNGCITYSAARGQVPRVVALAAK